MVNLYSEYHKVTSLDRVDLLHHSAHSDRLEIVASVFSVVVLFGVTAFVMWDAVSRLCCGTGEGVVDEGIVFGFTGEIGKRGDNATLGLEKGASVYSCPMSVA